MSEASKVRLRAAQFILDAEARRDEAGHLKVYTLPASDGGGTFEVAGINDGYHPHQARLLRAMLAARSWEAAETYARDFIAEYTDTVTRWTTDPALEVFLRDCCFNRGPKGALRILQGALRVEDDGKFGPITLAALQKERFAPGPLLARLRVSRENYELRIAPPVGGRAKFWAGLVNRWNHAHEFARGFLNPPPSPLPVETRHD